MDAQVKTTDSVFVRNSRAINFVVNKIKGQSENSVASDKPMHTVLLI